VINKNLLWDEAIDKELEQVVNVYNTLGRNQIPKGYQLIRVNMVFDDTICAINADL